jgi:nucleotidyltransferase substrate binding protein (TIGR01987 family)
MRRNHLEHQMMLSPGNPVMTDKLDLSALRNALASLEASIAIVDQATWFAQQAPALQNTIIAGVIQNFEFVYELGIKMIRRQLELEAASPTEVDESSFRDLIRAAGEKGLIANVEAWFGYRRMRNITAHTYDHAKARQVYEGSLVFVKDARALLAALESRHG